MSKRILQLFRYNLKYLYKYMCRQRQSSQSLLALKLPDGSAADFTMHVDKTFREYFHGILNGPKLSTFPTLHNGTFNTSLKYVDFSIPDIRKRLWTCNPYGSIGSDNVYHRILREAEDALAPDFTIPLKNALKTGRSHVSGGRLPSSDSQKGSRHSLSVWLLYLVEFSRGSL